MRAFTEADTDEERSDDERAKEEKSKAKALQKVRSRPSAIEEVVDLTSSDTDT